MYESIRVEVLAELQRIGVDADALPAPLIGTGLRARDVVAWLRAVPDNAGVAELTRRLDEHARQAIGDLPLVRWTREPGAMPGRNPRERDWPTQELLDAGTEMLLEEWDPFTLRHGEVDRENVAMCAFHFFGCFLSPNGMTDPASHATGMIEHAETSRLGVAPSPERHRRYLAGRLAELVSRYPVPQRRHVTRSGMVVVAFGGDAPGPPPLDPEGVCARCLSFGTVAKITEFWRPPTIRRYCEPCWMIVRP